MRLGSVRPQRVKLGPADQRKDLSMGMLTALTLGLGLWIVYGVLRGDCVIVAANAICTALTAIVLGGKVRDQD